VDGDRRASGADLNLPSESPRSLRPILAAFVLIQAALFLYYVSANLVLQPYWDMYAHVMRYLQFRADHAWWPYLWEPHVQHRHLWMRLLTAFDIEVFAGIGYPFVVAAVACQATTAWLVWRELRRSGDGGRLLGGLAVMLVLTSVAAVDCATPINGVYPQAVMFSVLSLVLFNGPLTGAGNGATTWHRWGGILAAVAAAFANAIALALWPILAWTAWRAGAGWRWLAGVVIIGTAFIAAYVHGLPATDVAHASSVVLERANYLVTYMGLPWTRAAALDIPGRMAGAGLTVVSLWSVIYYGLWRPELDRRERIAVGLVLLSLASATLAALGRVEPDSAVLVPVRYTVLVIPLHVGLLMLLVPQMSLARVSPRFAVLAAVLLVGQQVAAGEAAKVTTARMRDTLDRFAAGETQPEMRSVVFVNLEQARRQFNEIRQAGLYRNAR
jgi:hypothetical protein